MNNEEKIEGKDYVICKLCGKQMKAIQGRHLTVTHGITSKEYQQMFPGEKMLPDNYAGGFRQHKGKHMKEEKYRKMFSDKWKGENNRNSKKNTTEQQRKERSPFSKEFYVKRNLPDENRAKLIDDVSKNRSYNTQLSYYTDKGFSEDEAKILLKDRQTTFSLEKCIKKYGAEEGLKKWTLRQEKWKAKVFSNDQWIGKGTSALTENIIIEIMKYGDENLLYGKNEKFIYDKENKRVYKYDITNLRNKKIIEINGVFWHCKPELYGDDYYNKIKKMFAKEIRDYDIYKLNIAKEHGYDVLVIWEDDYHNNPKETIVKCVNFIYA